ncbi:hypothetical protein [Ensifer sp. YR511]|uniref:hypothetical protein n=1 Tax=Ensifer sp. YR511 TaxID=1855294 RepID=UPI00088D3B6B|nr:hypothetical protein [Ensifer sp. YR511]SDO05785.1 hypothetical protein SAMN05216328_1517 [Ensifer sp. YR511]
MAPRIDDSPERELGLTGRYADTPAFQIINDTHDLFLALMSRLIGLEYGCDGDALKSHPLWFAIEKERFRLTDRLSALGGDAAVAAILAKEIRRLDENVNTLVTLVSSKGTAV